MSGRCLDDPDEGYRLKCAGPEVMLFFQMLLELQPSQRFDLLHASQKHCQLHPSYHPVSWRSYITSMQLCKSPLKISSII